MRDAFATAGQLAGLTLIAVGATLVWVPFGIIVSGIAVFGIGWVLGDKP